MTALVAFLAGAVAGGGAVAAVGWHLLRTAREAWHAAEAEEITAKQVAQDYVDANAPRWVL